MSTKKSKIRSAGKRGRLLSEGPSAAVEPLQSENRPPRIGTNFDEAVGKTVAFINYVSRPDYWYGLEVRFTDGTLFHFRFCPQIEVQVQYLERRHGTMETLREYGVLRSDRNKQIDE